MTPAEPSLREQLSEARTTVKQQIERLRPGTIRLHRPDWFAAARCRCVLPAYVAPFRATGVLLGNSDPIAKLTQILHDIEDALEGLGPGAA
jgi:hypothetical protein